MNKEEASILLEETIATLIEVGDGMTYEDLHKASEHLSIPVKSYLYSSTNKLLKFRDDWFKKMEVWVEPTEED